MSDRTIGHGADPEILRQITQNNSNMFRNAPHMPEPQFRYADWGDDVPFFQAVRAQRRHRENSLNIDIQRKTYLLGTLAFSVQLANNGAVQQVGLPEVSSDLWLIAKDYISHGYSPASDNQLLEYMTALETFVPQQAENKEI